MGRIRRPSFWVLTALVPLLLAALYALPVVSARGASQAATVLVVDETGLFEHGLTGNDRVHFKRMPSLEYAERQRESEDAILYVPLRQTTIPHDAFLYYRGHEPSAEVQREVANQLQTLLRNAILEDVYQMEPSVYHSVETTHISLHTRDAATGHESFSRVKRVVGLVMALLVTLMVLIYGMQTMRAVQEERQNRTAEVMATSVSPGVLLGGKMAAVVLIAISQLVLWVVLTGAMIRGIQASAPELFAAAREQQSLRSLATKGEEAMLHYATPVEVVDETVQGLAAIEPVVLVGVALLFYVLGHLLYSSLLAAIAARTDTDADHFWWALLVVSPLVLTLSLGGLIVDNPSGVLAEVLSWVPFTAPAAVMLRLPFGVPVWNVAGAAVLLLAAAAGAVLVASRTYRRRLV